MVAYIKCFETIFQSMHKIIMPFAGRVFVLVGGDISDGAGLLDGGTLVDDEEGTTCIGGLSPARNTSPCERTGSSWIPTAYASSTRLLEATLLSSAAGSLFPASIIWEGPNIGYLK